MGTNVARHFITCGPGSLCIMRRKVSAWSDSLAGISGHLGAFVRAGADRRRSDYDWDTIVGSIWTIKPVEIFCLSLASGSILYIIFGELLTLGPQAEGRNGRGFWASRGIFPGVCDGSYYSRGFRRNGAFLNLYFG